MSDNEVTPESKPRRRAAGRPAGPPVDAPAEKADKAPAKAAAKKKVAHAKIKAARHETAVGSLAPQDDQEIRGWESFVDHDDNVVLSSKIGETLQGESLSGANYRWYTGLSRAVQKIARHDALELRIPIDQAGWLLWSDIARELKTRKGSGFGDVKMSHLQDIAQTQGRQEGKFRFQFVLH